ncbi:sugar ABC transporter permease [Streptomyces sp. LP11]|uniref:Sugar ABC transporter permease n=1 Tax=Streptomyces pyxinicus TaxID=2970331 RepID=A0ABT2AUV5_9ACTN|nr:sugar ABC transporter permease [Streptomyces sp. LP11]MCS0600043.1 sugar ABC transporter permease [Streptomyces sp. LP11]
MRNEGRWEPVARWLFVTPAVGYLLLFFGLPVAENVVMSLRDYTATTFYTGDAPFVGPRNYFETLSSDQFPQALLTTVVFIVGSLAGQFTLGLALALFFARAFPLGGVLRSLLLLPWLLPMVVSATTWRWMLDTDTGVVNHALRALHLVPSGVPWLTDTSGALTSVILVNIWVGIPFNTVILHGGLRDIPTQLYEAAELDGAGPLTTFRHITWPLLRPVAGVVLLLGAIYTVRVLDIILVMTGGGPADATQTLATRAYDLSFQQFEFGRGAALGNVLVLVSLVFAVVHLRAGRRALHG